MKLKELYKKYPDYLIMVWGQSRTNKEKKLKEYTKTMTPWTGIYTTNKREIYNMEVIEYFVEENEQKVISWGLDFKYKGTTISKGDVYVLVKKPE